MEHLTNDRIEAYWTGKLTGADLVSLDRHIAECQRCREALLADAPPASAFAGLESGADREPDGEHLEYTQLERYVDGDPSPELRVDVEGHIAICASCRMECEDLRKFRDEYRRPGVPRMRYATAALALAATLAIAAILIGYPGGIPGHRPPRARLEAYTMLLRDGGMPVGLNSQGQAMGLANLTASESAGVTAILRDGRLPLAEPRSELRTPAGLLRSAAAQPPEFQLDEPVGRTILEDRPVFRWTALAGASSYRVAILDADFKPVAASPALTKTEWQPEIALPRGNVYSWQVTAVRGGAELLAPQPPLPEARFAVLEQARAERLKAAQSNQPVSHLVLCLLYAQEGMRRECLRELDLLGAENPGSELVARLREQVAPNGSGR